MASRLQRVLRVGMNAQSEELEHRGPARRQMRKARLRALLKSGALAFLEAGLAYIRNGMHERQERKAMKATYAHLRELWVDALREDMAARTGDRPTLIDHNDVEIMLADSLYMATVVARHYVNGRGVAAEIADSMVRSMEAPPETSAMYAFSAQMGNVHPSEPPTPEEALRAKKTNKLFHWTGVHWASGPRARLAQDAVVGDGAQLLQLPEAQLRDAPSQEQA